MTKNKNCCPFWSATAGNCCISLDGLFIPLDKHVAKYCNSGTYIHCKQYHCTNQIEQKPSKTVSDRRQYDRHAESRNITIIKTDNYLDDSSLHVTAIVVDFSKGGIRLLLKENLNRNSAVTCSLGNEFPKHLRSGSAMIRWCEPLLNQNGFQAGLAFKDDILPLAISSHLDLP